jgi:hypothetical protein
LYYGVSLYFDAPGRLSGCRWYLDVADTQALTFFLYEANPPNTVHVGAVRNNAGPAPTVTGWVNTWFHPWFRYTVGVNYILVCQAATGLHWNTPAALTSPPYIQNSIEFWNDAMSTVFNGSGGTISTALPGIDPLVMFD